MDGVSPSFRISVVIKRSILTMANKDDRVMDILYVWEALLLRRAVIVVHTFLSCLVLSVFCSTGTLANFFSFFAMSISFCFSLWSSLLYMRVGLRGINHLETCFCYYYYFTIS